jgi:hypothetical protein
MSAKSILSMIFLILVSIFSFWNLKDSFKLILSKDYKNSNESLILIERFFNSIKEKKIYSQNKEDGVILSLISLLNLPKKGSSSYFQISL